MTLPVEEESASAQEQPVDLPPSIRLPQSGLPEAMRFLLDNSLELALMELQKWQESVDQILASHKPLRCNGLNAGVNCTLCKDKHNDSRHGRDVLTYYKKVVAPEPLWQDKEEEQGFDPYELEAAIAINQQAPYAVNVTQNPDDPMERAHDSVYNNGGNFIRDEPRRNSVHSPTRHERHFHF